MERAAKIYLIAPPYFSFVLSSPPDRLVCWSWTSHSSFYRLFPLLLSDPWATHPHCSPFPPLPHTNGIICYLCLSAWLISLNLISSRSMQATNDTVPLLRQNLIPLPSSIRLLMASRLLPSISYCDSCCSEPDSLYEVATLSLLGAYPRRAQLSHVRVSFFGFFMKSPFSLSQCPCQAMFLSTVH